MERNKVEQIKLFSEVDVLEPLPTQEISWIAQRTLERSLLRSDLVYVPGEESEVVFLLLKGRIRLYRTAVGQEFTFSVIQGGTIFGEASLAGLAHSEYAQALEPALVGLLNVNIFWRLVRESPAVNQRVVKLLVTRSSMNGSRMTDIAIKEVPVRLAGLILDLLQSEGVVTGEGHYRIATRYTHEQLATMIGAKRVAVSRAFATLQDSECVQLLSRQIHITDLDALSDMAMQG